MSRKHTILNTLSYGNALGERGVTFICHNPFDRGRHRKSFFNCPQCNKEFLALPSYVKSNKTVSCGCWRTSVRLTTHGMFGTPLYLVWGHMMQRTTNSNDCSYSNYGDRGITVCAEWKDFHNFKSWAESSGYAEGLTIDRKINSKGYSPSNCRWVTVDVQARNKRNNVWWIVDGILMCEKDAANLFERTQTCLFHWRTGTHRIPKQFKSRISWGVGRIWK